MKLAQWFTPYWVAEALLERHFRHLNSRDVILEPSCGTGSFLKAIPAHVEAFGVEIDPAIAAVARADSGRLVLVGDFRTVEIPLEPTAVIGNPPFSAELIDGFLARCHELLPRGATVGFLLPAYFLQTARRVTGYAERWSITTEMIPRNLFPRLREALTFATFVKDRRRLLVGMALYREAVDVAAMSGEYRELFRATRGETWAAVCSVALRNLRGEADLPSIYAEVEGHRHTLTKFWREKVRQTLRVYPDRFKPLGAGRYALAS